MNTISKEKQGAVLSCLVEGVGIRATARLTGVNRETVSATLMRAGKACAQILDETMRDLSCGHIEVDEVWTFVGKKQRHVLATDDPSKVGDFWTWAAIDRDTKLVPSHLVAKRSHSAGHAFIRDLASRLRNRVQLSSDGLPLYIDAVAAAFGDNVDYGQVVKVFDAEPAGAGRYSPPKVSSVERNPISGAPDHDAIGTSIAERSNLSLRMGQRRFTRLTNAFSKKVEPLRAAVNLYFGHYNLCRPHLSLENRTPAMAAAVSAQPWPILALLG